MAVRSALIISLCLLAWTTGWAPRAMAAACYDIFPDGASSTTNTGGISFSWGSKVYRSPDGVLDTRNLSHSLLAFNTCVSTNCSKSNNLVPTGTAYNFPSSSNDITVGWLQSRTLSPGTYRDISVGISGTLTLLPGVYVVTRSLSVSLGGEIILSTAGTTRVYAQSGVSFGSRTRVNPSLASSYLFLYTKGSVVIDGYSVDAIVYADGGVSLDSDAVVTGAVTAGGTISLDSNASIYFDAAAVANAGFDSFCSNSRPPPPPVGRWLMEQTSWTGAANEMLDSSGNNLHGRAVSLNGLPKTQHANPALPGNPGTCLSGDFKGTADGYLQINDPGTNSKLDSIEHTLSAWVNPRAWPSLDLQSILVKGDQWQVHLDPNGQLLYWWGGNNNRSLTAVGRPLATNTWHHIAVAFRLGSQAIYINGVLAASLSNSAMVYANNDPITIAGQLGGNNMTRRFDGMIDDVQLFSSMLDVDQINSLMAQRYTCSPVSALTQIQVQTPSSASTCSPSEVVITMRNAQGQILTGYTGTVALSTSTNRGDWSKTGNAADAAGTLTPGAGNSGAASYTFVAGDSGSVRLRLSNSHAQSLNVQVNEAVAGIAGEAAVTFQANAFVVDSADTLAQDVVAGRPHKWRIRMMRQDPVTGVCQVASGYQASQLSAWLVRSSADPGGAAAQLQSSVHTASLPNSLPGTANLNVQFSAGTETVSLHTTDVGQYHLSFADTSLAFSDQPILGSSPLLSVRPFGLHVSVPGNPAAADASGAVFRAAGSDFTVNVRAVAWQAGDDQNNDGLPDGHQDNEPGNNANLSDNASLVSFGREVPAQSVTLNAYLLSPQGGEDPQLGSSVAAPADARRIGNFTGGSGSTSNVYFNEVGVIELSARLTGSQYLANPRVIGGRSGRVGRFNPARMRVTNSTLVPACSAGLGFTYLAQPFTVNYAVDALSARNSLTRNYAGGYARLAPGLGQVNFRALDALGPTSLSTRLANPGNQFAWAQGSGALVSQLRVERAPSPDGPFQQVLLGVLLQDADGVGLAAADLDLDTSLNGHTDAVRVGQTRLRHGRLRLDDAYGPETADLPVAFLTEYWTGNAWRSNADDSCTALARAVVNYPDGAINSAANRNIAVGAGISTGHYGNLTAQAVNFSAGDARHHFSAPGAGNTGSFQVQVDLTAYPWLRFDWNGDGNHNDATPLTGNYTFGVYRGHDRILYWQELLRQP